MVVEANTQEVESTVEVRSAVESTRRLLFNALDSLEGEKTIVWDRDRSLMHRVNLFAGASALHAHGVVANQFIETKRPVETPNVLFFLSPTMSSLDLLCEYIDTVPNDSKTLYQLFFIPEAWYVVREKLKERANGKYWQKFESVREIPLSWLPRDGDCLSLSQSLFVSKLLLNGDWTYLHKCAVALHQLIRLGEAGREIQIFTRGKWSHDISRMLRNQSSASTDNGTPSGSSSTQSALNFNRIVIIDRWLDPLTPMLTQLTYSGLLDEVFPVGMVNSIKVPKAEFEEKEDDDPFEQKEIYLNDEIYHRLKHAHINGFGQEASKILTELRTDEQFDREKMSVAEYAVLVKKMPRILRKKNMTSIHMRLAEMIRMQLYSSLSDVVKTEKELLELEEGDKVIPFIEDQILEAAPVNRVLRLISVHSLTSSGLKPAVLHTYRRYVTQSYGVAALNKLLKMQKMGLIREKGGSGKMLCEYTPLLYPQMRKQYNLIPADVSELKADDVAYAYSGYASLLVRIIEEGESINWTGWEKSLLKSDDTVVADTSSKPSTCLFVVGGLTRAELATIRKLVSNIQLVTTTSLLTGDQLIENITNAL